MTEQTKEMHHMPEDVREHFRSAKKEIHQSMAGIFPPEFVEHRRAAHKEMLLAFRGLLDHAIQHIDEHSQKS